MKLSQILFPLWLGTNDITIDNGTSLQKFTTILQDIEKSGEAARVSKAVDIISKNESFKSFILDSVQTKCLKWRARYMN
jgi:hypothetical protein